MVDPKSAASFLHSLNVIVLVASLAIVTIIYFLPYLIARSRRHQNTTAIGLLDLLLGWSFFGWVAALVWAATEVRHAKSTTDEGASGLDQAPTSAIGGFLGGLGVIAAGFACLIFVVFIFIGYQNNLEREQREKAKAEAQRQAELNARGEFFSKQAKERRDKVKAALAKGEDIRTFVEKLTVDYTQEESTTHPHTSPKPK